MKLTWYNYISVSSGGLYKGTQAPQGAAGSAYDAMSGAKIKILADGNFENNECYSTATIHRRTMMQIPLNKILSTVRNYCL